VTAVVDTAAGELLTRARIASITVTERQRKDLGDLDALAASIRESGLLQPVVVNPEGRLVNGQRRLEAAKRLGWTEIDIHVVTGLDDARALLIAERDENTCRKDMTASELYGHGTALEALERPKAAERSREAGRVGGLKAGRGRPAETGVGSEEHIPNSHRTREAVGEGLGMSGGQWQRLRHVGDLAEQGDEQAREVLDAIDRGEQTIKGGYEQVRAERTALSEPKRQPAAERATQIRDLAEQGYRATQIADQLGLGAARVRLLARDHAIDLPDAALGKSRRIDPNRIVRETVATAEGLALGVALLNGEEVARLDPNEVEGWAASLSSSLRSLNQLAKQLKEMAS
jgi:ParB family chromosome partitioning protein